MPDRWTKILLSPDSDTGSGEGAVDKDPSATEKAGEESLDATTGNDAGQDDAKLKAARTDAAKYRKRAEAAETELQKMLDAAKTDEQRREEELVALREKAGSADGAIRALRVENAVIKACAEAGIIDPDAAVRMIDQESLIFDRDGNLDGESVKAALAALAAAKPYLVSGAPASIDGGARDGGQKVDINDSIRLAFRRRAGAA